MIYSSKLDFKALQPGAYGKPQEYTGDIKWPKGGAYGLVSMQSPSGETYKGRVENKSQNARGYLYNDHSAFNLMLNLVPGQSANGRGNIWLTPIVGAGKSAYGVLGGRVYYENSEPKPEMKTEPKPV